MPLWAGCILAPALGSLCAVFTCSVSVALWHGNAPFGGQAESLLYFSAALVPPSLATLAVVGLPLTYALRRVAYSDWWCVLGASLGAIVGWLVAASIEAMLPAPSVDEAPIFEGLGPYGAVLGGFTGLFWAALARNRLLQLQKEDPHEPPQSFPS